MKVDQLQEDLKQAQLAKDEVKVSTLRLLLAEIKNGEIAKGGSLTGEEIISVIQREVKKRKEAMEGFTAGGRQQAAQVEEAELKILAGYLPAQLPDEELTKIVEAAITEVGAGEISDMGKVMGAVMAKVGAGADGGRVSSLVKARLSK